MFLLGLRNLVRDAGGDGGDFGIELGSDGSGGGSNEGKYVHETTRKWGRTIKRRFFC